MILNQDQFLGILRALVPAGMAYAVGRGWVSASSAGEVSAAVITISAAVWSGFAHTNSAKLAAVEALPEVRSIVVKPMSSASSAAVEAAVDVERPKVTLGDVVNRQPEKMQKQ